MSGSSITCSRSPRKTGANDRSPTITVSNSSARHPRQPPGPPAAKTSTQSASKPLTSRWPHLTTSATTSNGTHQPPNHTEAENFRRCQGNTARGIEPGVNTAPLSRDPVSRPKHTLTIYVLFESLARRPRLPALYSRCRARQPLVLSIGQYSPARTGKPGCDWRRCQSPSSRKKSEHTHERE